jgi:hypothetical protein
MKDIFLMYDKYYSLDKEGKITLQAFLRERKQIKEEKEKDFIYKWTRSVDRYVDRYFDRFNEINQEVAANELFLFSILTERIKAAKAIWKRGKVRLNSNF